MISSMPVLGTEINVPAIKRFDTMQNFEVCETYVHFDQIAGTGKISIAGDRLNLRLILKHIKNLDEVRVLNISDID